MDRRSWLWRRKSSDKSPGETESSGSGPGSGSGSISSPSERFSDEQQAYSNQNMQSPEVTSKAAPPDEDAHDSVKILTEKLSAAAANISAKDELVKQHAKVAEEAVTGWEKAEKEVSTLKQQLDAATKKNSTLEDRIVHLDGALKECLRQLRQVREEQDERIKDAIAKESHDMESKRSELEEQLADICTQLETANAKAEAAVSLESDLRLKLGTAEKENASLRVELHSRLEELEVRTLERDLSTKTAETASKQHLESIKRVAKLEAECRRLKIMVRKATSFNIDSLTDTQSDSGERLTDCEPSNSDSWASSLKVEKAPPKGHMSSSTEISLMDDFLEMERLAALPERENRSFSLGSVASVDKHDNDNNDNISLKAELEVMINRTAQLEHKLEMVEAEKVELGSVLTQCQEKLRLSESQLNECQNQLKISQAQLREANKKLVMLQAEIDLANELRQAIDLELDDANVRREEAESQCKVIEDERDILVSKIRFLEGEAEKDRSLYADASAKCRALEDELSRIRHEANTMQSELTSTNDSKEAVEQELSRMKKDTDAWESRLTSVNDSQEAIKRELQVTNAKKDEAELQLKAVQEEAKSLLEKVGSLEHEVEKERTLSAEFAAKCRTLENELLKVKSEANSRFAPLSKEELDKQQEKELAVAANRLAECQRTIASLGKQLKSLATLEDLFSDSDKQLEGSGKEPQLLRNGVESDSSSSETTGQDTSAVIRESDLKFVKEGLSALPLDKSQKNGFGKLFSRTKSTVRSQG